MISTPELDYDDWNRLMTLTRLHDSGMLDTQAVIGRLKSARAKTIASVIVGKEPGDSDASTEGTVKLLRQVSGRAARDELQELHAK